MKTPQELRESRYVDGIIRGLTKKQAALEAGFSRSVAEHSIGKVHEKPEVQAAIQKARDESRAAAVYDLTKAMQESLEVIEFAKQNRNAMAYFKAVEHRAKLSGLLVERVAVEVQANVRVALDEARTRVLNWNGPVVIEGSRVIDPLS